ncbi:MAG: hypothetical protein E7571_03765 [Ruminococcaceae bacterium]|nr:hypothetical protein [Oscillospiraceae bacterium]
MNIISKKICAALLSFVFVIGSLPVTTFAAQNTFDLSAGVYDISTEADLLAFRDALDNENYFENATVNLLQDITMTQTYISPCSNGAKDVQFCGTFNGNNHTISNLNMVTGDNYTVSLLPFLGNATIKDLTLKDVTINEGYTWNAPFAPASLGDDKIINCHLEGNCIIQAYSDFSKNWNYNAGMVADNYMGSLLVKDCTVGENVVINGRGDSGKYRIAGGMVADSRDSTFTEIKNCVNRANISTDYLAGGMMGCLMTTLRSEDELNYAAIVDCFNYGNISVNESTHNNTAGIAGILAESSGFSPVTINRCANFGDITCSVNSANPIGGIVGYTESASISNSFNAGAVTAYDCSSVGGIAGQTRTNTYGSPITGSVDIGEFYFPQQYNSITNCYNVGEIKTIYGVSNLTTTGGVVGICQESDTQVGHSEVNNVYNFATVSSNNADSDSKLLVGTVTADTDILFKNAFAANGTKAITYLHKSDGSASPYTCKAGYYDNAGFGGKVYPTDVVSGPVISGHKVGNTTETKSDTPLSTDLKQTLDAFVDEVNPEFEQTDGKKFELLQWTYSDGSDGLGIHPVFGYDIENLDSESDKETNGGYLTTSKYGYEYYKLKESDDKTVTVNVNSNEGSTLKSLTVTDQNGNNVALTKVDDTTYTFTMPEADVTVDAEWEQGKTPNNTVYLTTKDSVDITFVVDADYYIPDESDREEAYVELNYNHNPITYATDFKTRKVNLTDVEKTDDGRYKFTIESAPAQLTESIRITLYSKDGDKLYDADYSMWEYCDNIIQNDIKIHETSADPEVVEKMDKAAEVCKALTDYATAAQVYFGYNTADMSSKKVDERTDKHYTDTFTKEKYFHDVCNVTTESIKNNGGAVANVQGELPFAITETSLMSLSNTEVRFYYEEDVDTADYELSVTGDNWYGGKAPSVSFGEANSGKFVQVKGIESANLDNVFHVTIRQKSTGKTATINYNALAYCYTVIRDTETGGDSKVKQLRSLVKSVYLYNRYAQEYFAD